MRHVKRSEEPDSIDAEESASSARSRAPARSLGILLAAVLGGSAYYFAEQLLALWSPTTGATETMRLALGGGLAVLVLALSVLLPAAAKARRASRGVAQDEPEAVPSAEHVAEVPTAAAQADASGPSPEEMMLSLESELNAAAAELAAELERAANEDLPVDPYAVDGTELDIEGEATPDPVIVAVDPPQALAAIPIPVWVDEVVEPTEAAAPAGSDSAGSDSVDPIHVDPIHVDPIHVDPMGALPPDVLTGEATSTEVSAPEAVVDETPDADGNTNPTVRVLQAQIRSLEEALFRQSAAEAHPAEPQPELPRAASKDEVTREVLARVRHTIRGLGVRMGDDPVAADVLARVEAAVDRLAETGFFVRPTLSEPDATGFAASDIPIEPTGQVMDEPDEQFEAPAEHWGNADALAGSTEVAAEYAAQRTATAVIDDRPLAERLAAEVVLEEPEAPEPVADQADVVLPVPAGPTTPTVQRSRRWRRGAPVA